MPLFIFRSAGPNLFSVRIYLLNLTSFLCQKPLPPALVTFVFLKLLTKYPKCLSIQFSDKY